MVKIFIVMKNGVITTMLEIIEEVLQMGKSSKKRRKERRMKERFGVPTTQDNSKNNSTDMQKGVQTFKSASTSAFKKLPPCHYDTQIYTNLYVGSLNDAYNMAGYCDVLVPLDSLDGDIWHFFNGDIHYWPITDMSILPESILTRAVQDIADCLEDGKKVGIFCLGGHGRTGYIAGCVLGYLGVEDPIGYLRENYCKKAVETREQAEEIGKFIGNDELADKYFPKSKYGYYDDFYSWGYPINLHDYYYGGHSLFGNVQPTQGLKVYDYDLEEELEEIKEEYVDSFDDFHMVNEFLINNG